MADEINGIIPSISPISLRFDVTVIGKHSASKWAWFHFACMASANIWSIHSLNQLGVVVGLNCKSWFIWTCYLFLSWSAMLTVQTSSRINNMLKKVWIRRDSQVIWQAWQLSEIWHSNVMAFPWKPSRVTMHISHANCHISGCNVIMQLK